jgi:putative chitinase
MKLEEILAQVYPHLPAAQRAEYAPLMEAAFTEFDITTKPRIAAVLSQLGVESNELKVWEENLNYSAKRLCQVWPKRFPSLDAAAPFANNPQALANKVYSGRMGNTGPGDGWNFRGRTPVQLTGRDNYKQVAKFLKLPLEDNPDLANDKATAFRVVGSYFRDIRPMLNVADKGDIKAVTFAVNGGYTDLEKRTQYYQTALKVIPDGFKLAASAPQTAPAPPVVHEETDEEEAAAASAAEQPPATHATHDVRPEPQPATTVTSQAAPVGAPAQSAAVPAVVVQPTVVQPPQVVQQPTVPPGVVEAAQKVQQSNSSKATAWFPMIAGPLAAIWLGIKASLENPFVLAAVVVFVLGGFVVGAWLWNESKKRQAAAQHKLIEAAAATDKQTVVINPPPPKAG